MTPNPARPLKGIALVVLATFAFASADVLTKHLTQNHPIPVVVAMRYLVNMALLLVLLYPRIGPKLWQVQHPGLVFLRGFCLALASLTLGLALRLMPVGETVAIVYLSPFAVMLLAIPLLGEKVRPLGWLWTALGFGGVLLILRPGGGLDPWGVAFALMNACLATAYHLLTRKLAHSESTIAMLFQTALVGSVFFSIGSLTSLSDLHFSAPDLTWLLVLGVLATLGHYLFTAAYREAPAAILAPIGYLHLVWATGLGVVVFGHAPDTISLCGMALVCASGVANAISAKRG